MIPGKVHLLMADVDDEGNVEAEPVKVTTSELEVEFVLDGGMVVTFDAGELRAAVAVPEREAKAA